MEDITSLAAIRAYFEFYRDLYGKEDLDREKILIAFENEMLRSPPLRKGTGH